MVHLHNDTFESGSKLEKCQSRLDGGRSYLNFFEHTSLTLLALPLACINAVNDACCDLVNLLQDMMANDSQKTKFQ